MGRNFRRIGKLHWVDDLQALVSNYNHSVHRTIQAKPYDVWHGKVMLPAHTPRREVFRLHEGDRVRLWLHKNIFDKRAGAQKWSTKVFTIARRVGLRYVVKNEQGEELKTKYKPRHLQLVAMEPDTDDAKTRKSVEESETSLRKEKRKQRFLRRQGLLPVTRFARFRPSRTRRRPRNRN